MPEHPERTLQYVRTARAFLTTPGGKRSIFSYTPGFWLGGLVTLHLMAQGYGQAVSIGAQGILVLAQLLQQLAQLFIGLGPAAQHDAGLEVAAGLAPEFGHHAQPPGGEQERRALTALRQPIFDAAQLPLGMLAHGETVERQQFLVPVRLQCVADRLLR